MKKTVSVAPMMDCTDKHEIYFLSLISKNIHLYTEMIVANAIIRGDKTKLLSFKKINNPVTLQVGGSNPNELAEACKISEDYGYKEINLNLGCPSKKVQKNKFGACLMQEPDLVAKCIEAMAKASKLPVTIKTRIGYNDVENFEFLKSFIQTTKDAGSQKFIIHARKALLKKLTPKENLNIPPLKYDFVYKLKDYFRDDEIIINGGVKTIEEIKNHLTKVDGVMIGRAAEGRPWLINQIKHYLDSGRFVPNPTAERIKSAVLQHYADILSHYGISPGLRIARKHLCWYVSGFQGAAKLRAKLGREENPDTVIALLNDFFNKQFELAAG